MIFSCFRRGWLGHEKETHPASLRHSIPIWPMDSLLKWLFMLTHETDHFAQATSCFCCWCLLSQAYEMLPPSPWDTTHLQLSQDYETTLPWDTVNFLMTTWPPESSCRWNINSHCFRESNFPSEEFKKAPWEGWGADSSQGSVTLSLSPLVNFLLFAWTSSPFSFSLRSPYTHLLSEPICSPFNPIPKPPVPKWSPCCHLQTLEHLIPSLLQTTFLQEKLSWNPRDQHVPAHWNLGWNSWTRISLKTSQKHDSIGLVYFRLTVTSDPEAGLNWKRLMKKDQK